MIHLFNDRGQDTGESFKDWNEVYAWYWSLTGVQCYSRIKSLMWRCQWFFAAGKMWVFHIDKNEEAKKAA